MPLVGLCLALAVAAWLPGCAARVARVPPREVPAADVAKAGKEWACVVFDMMDCGEIRQGSSIAVVRERLGAPEHTSALADAGGLLQDYYAQPQPPSPSLESEPAQGQIMRARPGPVGWYLVVQHDGTHVQGYYLSNHHGK